MILRRYPGQCSPNVIGRSSCVYPYNGICLCTIYVRYTSVWVCQTHRSLRWWSRLAVSRVVSEEGRIDCRHLRRQEGVHTKQQRLQRRTLQLLKQQRVRLSEQHFIPDMWHCNCGWFGGRWEWGGNLYEQLQLWWQPLTSHEVERGVNNIKNHSKVTIHFYPISIQFVWPVLTVDRYVNPAGNWLQRATLPGTRPCPSICGMLNFRFNFTPVNGTRVRWVVGPWCQATSPA